MKMRKNTIIEKLQAIEGNPPVVIANWSENLADGGDTGAGMYSDIDISLQENGADPDDIEPGDENFIALSFDDASRDENGRLIEYDAQTEEAFLALQRKFLKHLKMVGMIEHTHVEKYFTEAINALFEPLPEFQPTLDTDGIYCFKDDFSNSELLVEKFPDKSGMLTITDGTNDKVSAFGLSPEAFESFKETIINI